MMSRMRTRNVMLDPAADPGVLGGRYYEDESGGIVTYRVRRLPVALAASFVAGNVSSLLGIGGGVIKVPALNAWCGVPLRAAAATSAFMIGVTATSGAVIYYGHGQLNAPLAAAAVLGVQAGIVGRDCTSARARRSKWLKLLMAVVLLVVSVVMFVQGDAMTPGRHDRLEADRRPRAAHRRGDELGVSGGSGCCCCRWRRRPRGGRAFLLNVGLIILMVTPVGGVVDVVVQYARARDWTVRDVDDDRAAGAAGERRRGARVQQAYVESRACSAKGTVVGAELAPPGPTKVGPYELQPSVSRSPERLALGFCVVLLQGASRARISAACSGRNRS